MEDITLHDLYYAKDLKEKVDENPFDLSRFIVLFFKLYTKKTFMVTKGDGESLLPFSQQVIERVRNLKALLKDTQVKMPDIDVLLGLKEITPKTEIKMSTGPVLDVIITIHSQQVSHELITKSLEAHLKLELYQTTKDLDYPKIEKLKADIVSKTEERTLMINCLQNIGEALEKHIEDNVEKGLFAVGSEHDDSHKINVDSDLETVEWAEESEKAKFETKSKAEAFWKSAYPITPIHGHDKTGRVNYVAGIDPATYPVSKEEAFDYTHVVAKSRRRKKSNI